MPFGDPAGYLPTVKRARKRGAARPYTGPKGALPDKPENRRVSMIPRPGASNPRAYVAPGESFKKPARKPRYAAPTRSDA